MASPSDSSLKVRSVSCKRNEGSTWCLLLGGVAGLADGRGGLLFHVLVLFLLESSSGSNDLALALSLGGLALLDGSIVLVVVVNLVGGGGLGALGTSGGLLGASRTSRGSRGAVFPLQLLQVLA